MGWSSGLGRCPGGRHSDPVQSSCLENPIDRGAWWATVHSVTRVGHDHSNLTLPVGYWKLFPSEFSKFAFASCTTQVQNLGVVLEGRFVCSIGVTSRASDSSVPAEVGSVLWVLAQPFRLDSPTLQIKSLWDKWCLWGSFSFESFTPFFQASNTIVLMQYKC